MIQVSDPLREQAEDGITDLILVAIRYTGPKSVVDPSDLRRQAKWPGHGNFQGGPAKEWRTTENDVTESEPPRGLIQRITDRHPGSWQLGLVPEWNDPEVVAPTDQSAGVTTIEQMENWEVAYDSETIAEVFLDRTYLPPQVFGRGFDPFVRDAVFDSLGLDDEGVIRDDGSEEKYRSQLRELAGREDSPDQSDDDRIQEVASAFRRSELMTAANEAGKDDTNVSKTELAEYLVEETDDPAEQYV